MPPDARPVSREIDTKLDQYEALLRKWQPKINLVSPASLPDARMRHFEDSLQLAPYIPASAHTLYDLGSGAGFPGLVLAMVRPDLAVHLFEVDQRKSAFLQTVSRETSTPVTVHVSRVEAVTVPAPDVITARALASLSALLKLTERWWEENPDCALILPKGAAYADEVTQTQNLYEFDVAIHPSSTDSAARILVLRHMKKRL